MATFNDFDGLALFTRIAKAGGLAAAERATGIPKATLSRRLAALEMTLRVRLVRRTKRGIVLTDAGLRLFERSRVALGIAEEVVSEVQGDRARVSGSVRISLPPDIGSAVLAPSLIPFKAAHPGVEIEIALADRRVSLIEEGYDVAVRMGPVAASELLSRRIVALPRVLVASPGFLDACAPLDGPDRLDALPALAIRRDLTGWELRAEDGRTVTVSPKVGFSVNRQIVLVDAATAGLGIANLPVFMVAPALAAGTLRRVLPAWTPTSVDMTALWQRHRINDRLIEAVVKTFMQACAAGDLGGPSP